MLPKVQKQLEQTRKTLKRAQGQNHRLRKQVSSLKAVVDSLKEQQLISESAEKALQVTLYLQSFYMVRKCV